MAKKIYNKKSINKRIAELGTVSPEVLSAFTEIVDLCKKKRKKRKQKSKNKK